jgi:predicted RNA binding protein YcfA (HicA-like mRNA interferase family)
MTRLPQLTAQELVRFLKKQGFVEDRQTGSHLTLRHEVRKVSVTIPVHSAVDIGRGLALRILKDAGFSADDYVKLRRTR